MKKMGWFFYVNILNLKGYSRKQKLNTKKAVQNVVIFYCKNTVRSEINRGIVAAHASINFALATRKNIG
jgi:hypothetical protein